MPQKKRFTRRGVSTIRANLKPVEFLFAPKTVLQSFGKTRVTWSWTWHIQSHSLISTLECLSEHVSSKRHARFSQPYSERLRSPTDVPRGLILISDAAAAKVYILNCNLYKFKLILWKAKRTDTLHLFKIILYLRIVWMGIKIDNWKVILPVKSDREESQTIIMLTLNKNK